jgi:PAS domain S-box-containing protein
MGTCGSVLVAPAKKRRAPWNEDTIGPAMRLTGPGSVSTAGLECRYTSQMAADEELVFELDADGVIVAVNGVTEVATGYAAGELLGRPYHHLVAAENAALVTREFERKRRDPSVVSRYKVPIRRADGSMRLIEVSSRRTDTTGGPYRVRVSARTID